MTDTTALAAALEPLIRRVRTDVTAVKKANGEQAWTTQALTPERLERHLNGGPPRGVCPIKAGESVTMVALLDFDSHGGEVGWSRMSEVVRSVCDVLEMADGASPIVFRSSGGRGMHLYLLWDQPQDARSVRVWLKSVLASVGLRNGTKGVGDNAVEVFPKQDSVPLDGNGNQFILPLAGKSCALEWEDLSGIYSKSNRIAWPSSPPVPIAPPAEPRVHVEVKGYHTWRNALDALENSGVTELEYDDWRNVVFGIHHETGGSDDGLDLAIAWSARSRKHDEVFLTERVWPYVRSDRGGAVITGRTIMSLAAKLHGWHEPLSGDSFDVVIGDDDGDDFHGGPWGGARDAGVAGGVRGDAGEHGVDLARTEESSGRGSDATVHHERHGAQGEPKSDERSGERAHDSDADGAVQVGAADDGGASVAAGDEPAARSDGVDQHARRRGGIPDAEHLTTDQSNANRLVRLHGRRVLVAESRWHVWDGCRWLADEGDVYRYACGLSKVVRDEATEWERRAARLADAAAQRIAAVQSGNMSQVAGARVVDTLASGEGGQRAVGAAKAVIGEAIDPADLDEIRRSRGLAESLGKWSVRSEMKATVDAAVGLARKMLGVETDRLDADPWLLNTPTGVVDLRTGTVRPARAADLMTKLAGVGYVPGADQSAWVGLVSEICGGDVELVEFLQRWFGYCATGSVRERVFVVHWGDGKNGKSTIIDVVTRVLGDYSGTAAPGLLAGGGGASGAFERHPTEVAGLRGKRMVTAHESEDAAVLREGFIKQATGGDRLTGRFMREDFFEFDPTHKLQLLTNHKPTIKGNDPAIWSRVLLVPYLQAFGTAADVEAGRATRVGDLRLKERLLGDAAMLAGVMAWVVDGAVSWAVGGLAAPAAVRAASEGYRAEQDRVGQFVRECCEVAPAGVMAVIRGAGTGLGSALGSPEVLGWSEPLTMGMQGLFPAYAGWCREGGYHGLGRGRFGDALARAVPGSRVVERAEVGASGRRRVARVFGLKLLEN